MRRETKVGKRYILLEMNANVHIKLLIKLVGKQVKTSLGKVKIRF